MIVHNGNIVVNNGRWIIPERMKYKVNLIQTEGGTISAVPVTGINGTTVTLSNTPNQYYTFNGYTVNGATLYSGNKFDFDNSDVTVSASFKWNYVDPVVGETVKIGNQIWMKNTLAVDTTDYGLHKQNVTINGVNYGTIYYYQYRLAKSIVDNIPGWHIPTEAEYRTLWNTTGETNVRSIAYKLKDTKGWPSGETGNNATGFGAAPFGYRGWSGGDTSGDWTMYDYGKAMVLHGYETDQYVNALLEITPQASTTVGSNGGVKIGSANYSSQATTAWKQILCPVRLIKDS